MFLRTSFQVGNIPEYICVVKYSDDSGIISDFNRKPRCCDYGNGNLMERGILSRVTTHESPGTEFTNAVWRINQYKLDHRSTLVRYQTRCATHRATGYQGKGVDILQGTRSQVARSGDNDSREEEIRENKRSWGKILGSGSSKEGTYRKGHFTASDYFVLVIH